MLKELVAAVPAAALVLGLGWVTLVPTAALAAGKDKQPSICDKLTDKKKRAKCIKDEAMAKYNAEIASCDKIADKKKKASCQKAAANQKKKTEKKKTEKK